MLLDTKTSLTPEVLVHYPEIGPTAPALALGNAGGFSGARLWRVSSSAGPWCLRAWQPGARPAHVSLVHEYMAQARHAGRLFVPAILPTASRTTWTVHAGRIWEVCTWMPGEALKPYSAGCLHTQSALKATAQLHQTWRHASLPPGSCPAVRRRLDFIHAWRNLIQSGWSPASGTNSSGEVAAWAQRGWALVQTQLPTLSARLEPWLKRPVPLQPCLCDVWRENVLFDGNRVSGIVDYANLKMDSVATDVSRLLQSLVGPGSLERDAGLVAYTEVRPLAALELELVGVLDETESLLAIAQWLRKLYQHGVQFESESAVVRRLGELVERVEASAHL